MRYYGKRKRYGGFKRRLGVKRRMGKRLQRRYGSFNKRFRAKRYFRKATVPSLLPQRCFVTLRSVIPFYKIEDGPLAGGNISTIAIRGNGAFDPIEPTGGPSPKYFGWYNQVYAYYRVHAAKIYVTFYNLSKGDDVDLTGDVVCGVYVSDRVAPYTTLATAMEEVTSKWKDTPRMMNIDVNGDKWRTAHDARMIKHGAMTKKVLVVKDISDSSLYYAPVNGNPTKQWYFNLFCGRHITTPALSNTKVYARITVVYKMEFFDRQELDI